MTKHTVPRNPKAEFSRQEEEELLTLRSLVERLQILQATLKKEFPSVAQPSLQVKIDMAVKKIADLEVRKIQAEIGEKIK